MEADETKPPALTTENMVPQTRFFGQGFGRRQAGKPYQVPVYTHENADTGPVLETRECHAIEQWVGSDNPQTITDVLGKERTMDAFQTRLMGVNTLQMMQLAIDILPKLTDASRKRLFSPESLSSIPPYIYESIQESRPDSLPKNPVATNIAMAFLPVVARPELTTVHRPYGPPDTDLHAPRDVAQIGGVDAELFAILLPMLLAAQKPLERADIIADMTRVMHEQGTQKHFFAPLAERGWNQLVVQNPLASMPISAIYNNGRSLQVHHQDPGAIEAGQRRNDQTSLHFQGKDFYPVQFHFHRNAHAENGKIVTTRHHPEAVRDEKGKPDGQLEFLMYRDHEQEDRAKKHSKRDPNNDVVGELHSIFANKDPLTGHKTALAVCAHVVLGEANPQIQSYIDAAQTLFDGPMKMGDQRTPSQPLFNPLTMFTKGPLTGEALASSPFISLHLGVPEVKDGKVSLAGGSSDIFYNGSYPVHCKERITISPEQFTALEKLQPEFAVLDPKNFVMPIPKMPIAAERTPSHYRPAANERTR